MKKNVLLALAAVAFLAFFASCEKDDSIGGLPYPWAQIAFDAPQQQQTRGFVDYIDNAVPVIGGLSCHLPSEGGEFVVKGSYAELYQTDDTDNDNISISLSQIYSPLTGQFYNIGKDFADPIDRKSGISELKRISDNKISLSIEGNKTQKPIVYNLDLTTSFDKGNSYSSTFRFVVWPEGSDVDRYYNGEISREELVKVLKTSTLK